VSYTLIKPVLGGAKPPIEVRRLGASVDTLLR
jgi:hypothetical protein